MDVRLKLLVVSSISFHEKRWILKDWEETVALWCNNGLIQNYADLYEPLNSTEAQVIPLERMAEKSAENLIKDIRSLQTNSFERVLFALGVRFVGTVAKNWQSITKYRCNCGGHTGRFGLWTRLEKNSGKCGSLFLIR